MQEESTRLAGEHNSGRVTSNFYIERTAVLACNIQLLPRTNCCAIKKIIDYNFLCLYVKCTWSDVLFRRWSLCNFLLCLSCDVMLSNFYHSGEKCTNFKIALPLFYLRIQLCLGFIAASAAAEEAARMAASARRARQLLGKEKKRRRL